MDWLKHGFLYLLKVVGVGLLLGLALLPVLVVGTGAYVLSFQILYPIATVFALFHQVSLMISETKGAGTASTGQRSGQSRSGASTTTSRGTGRQSRRSGANSPTEIVEWYFELVDKDRDTTHKFPGLLHSEAGSKLEDTAEGLLSRADTAVDHLEPAVEAEDLDAAALETELATFPVDEARIERTAEAIAGRNAVVETDVAISKTTFEPGRFLVAPQDGNERDWRIVSFQ